jgi:hypothetical protein
MHGTFIVPGAAAGPHSRQRALLGVGKMSGGRREGAVSEEQAGRVQTLQILKN